MARENPIMLWETNHWDGPLSGVALYQGRKVWFEHIEWGGYQFSDETMFSEDLDRSSRYYVPRTFGLYELTPRELALQEEIHRRFQQCVGYHWDHDSKVAKSALKGNEEKRKQFYEWMKTVPPRQYTDRPEMAHFREDQFQQYQRPYVE